MMLPLRSLMYPLVACTIFAATLLGAWIWPTIASAAGAPWAKAWLFQEIQEK